MRGFSAYKTSALALLAANVLPLFGVLFWGWDAFVIVVLYWVENVVIGMINILKMITCCPDPETMDWSTLGKPERVAAIRGAFNELGGLAGKAKLAHHASKLFLVPFFAFHYGMFCFVHGVFVLALFGQDKFIGGPLEEFHEFSRVVSEHHLGWAVAALAASHLLSYFVNFLGRGEYRRTAVPILMMQPYGRVVVLHLAILFGGFVAMSLGSNVGVLSILVVGKTLLDLKFHLRERERNAVDKSAAPPENVLDEAARL